MKWLLIGCLLAGNLFNIDWQKDFSQAQKIAKEKDRCILLNFSGSDWCIPCMRLRKEVFETPGFQQLADSSLVLFNADFPRNKKNLPSKDIQKANELLADKYNAGGQFPLTLLLDPEGKIIHSWEGYPRNDAALFLRELQSASDEYQHKK